MKHSSCKQMRNHNQSLNIQIKRRVKWNFIYIFNQQIKFFFINKFPELEGLEPDVYENIKAVRKGNEVRVTAGWLNTPMFKIVARALSSKGFGRHVAGKDSYWSNKMSMFLNYS